MPSPILLEVCVETVASAVAAERGGAHRIELCSNLAVDGVTPTADLIQQVRRQTAVPMHVLIRPRAGDFCYTPSEFETMKGDIAAIKVLGVSGLVFGILDRKACIDVARTRELVQSARPLSVTFHRAFDECPDLLAALEDVVKTGADRILTTGGRKTVEEGASMLARLVTAAAGRIGILACGTIRESNVRKIVEATGVREVHASLLARPVAGRSAGDPLHGAEYEQPVLQPETVARFLEAAGKGLPERSAGR
jgi:copper homeostasis protein